MARLKTINKLIKLRIPNDSFKKEIRSWHNDCKYIMFYVNGKLQTTHFFSPIGFDLFFKDVLGFNFDIFIKKILLFKKKLSNEISKYPFDNPLDKSTNPTNLSIHYFNESDIKINKPDMFVFNYGDYSFYFNTNKNGSCFYKEKNSNTNYSHSKFIFDSNYDCKSILFKFLKNKLEQKLNFKTESISKENIESYISLVEITNYK